MRRTFALLATTAFALSLAGASSATPALDAKGKCRDAGKFVAAELCKPPAAAAAAAGGAPHCDKGKPCGHSCIAKDKVCHK